MYSFRRIALVLALALPVSQAVWAADSSSLSSNPVPQPEAQQQAGQTAGQLTPGEMTVQERIRARRAQRRAQAIQDAYANKWEVFVGGGYLRFQPGPKLQRVTLYSWDVAGTRFFNEKLGLTVDGRGYYGTPFVGLNITGLTRPAISQYDAMAGPTYRFFLGPKYSVAARVMGGYAHGNFSGDTSGFGTQILGLYPDGDTYALNGAIIGEMNLSPNFSLRLAGENMTTGFGSDMQNSNGFTYGFVVRFGKR